MEEVIVLVCRNAKIIMQEVKNYYAGRKGSPREVRNGD